MFDADAILTTVNSLEPRGAKALPHSWHIYYAKKPHFLAAGIVVALSVLLLLILTSIISIAAGGPQLNLVIIVGIAVLVGILIGLVVWLRRKDGVLVIASDGFVEKTDTHTFSVSYAELEHMELNVHSKAFPAHTCALEPEFVDEVSDLKLTLRYLDGHEIVWTPAKVFGPSLDIAPYINEGYVQYFALKKMNARFRSPSKG